MGEGMLVGSFARSLFLVHSECAESRYIASRPFRVNAGPVRRSMMLGWVGLLFGGSQVAFPSLGWPVRACAGRSLCVE